MSRVTITALLFMNDCNLDGRNKHYTTCFVSYEAENLGSECRPMREDGKNAYPAPAPRIIIRKNLIGT